MPTYSPQVLQQVLRESASPKAMLSSRTQTQTPWARSAAPSTAVIAAPRVASRPAPSTAVIAAPRVASSPAPPTVAPSVVAPSEVAPSDVIGLEGGPEIWGMFDDINLGDNVDDLEELVLGLDFDFECELGDPAATNTPTLLSSLPASVPETTTLAAVTTESTSGTGEAGLDADTEAYSSNKFRLYNKEQIQSINQVILTNTYAKLTRHVPGYRLFWLEGFQVVETTADGGTNLTKDGKRVFTSDSNGDQELYNFVESAVFGEPYAGHVVAHWFIEQHLHTQVPVVAGHNPILHQQLGEALRGKQESIG